MHEKEDLTTNPRIIYADIIDLPHHKSSKRPHMSLYDRSAQFAAYKALSGYEDMVFEEARLTDRRIGQGDYELELLAQKLDRIHEETEKGRHPLLTFTVFVPDEKKAGGKYIEITDSVKRIDIPFRKVILMSTEGYAKKNRTIDFDMISDVRGDLVDAL